MLPYIRDHSKQTRQRELPQPQKSLAQPSYDAKYSSFCKATTLLLSVQALHKDEFGKFLCLEQQQNKDMNDKAPRQTQVEDQA